MPIITPKRPRALPKISTTRIFTKRVASCASDKAALLPTIPTQTLSIIKVFITRNLAISNDKAHNGPEKRFNPAKCNQNHTSLRTKWQTDWKVVDFKIDTYGLDPILTSQYKGICRLIQQ